MHIGRKLSGWVALGVFAAIGSTVATDPAFAKVDVDKLTVGGEARIRYEYRIGGTFGTTKSNESAASNRVRVNVGYDLTPDVSFFAQIQDARAWGGEGNVPISTSGIGAVSNSNNNGTGIDLHQGYILLKNIVTPGLSAKLGRQEIIFGDHRLFGNFGWSQIGNSFDAVRLTHSTAFMDVDLFWARIADTEALLAANGVPNGVIFPGAAAAATQDQDVYGAYLTLKPMPNWTIEPYYFLLSDHRPTLVGATGINGTATTPQAPNQTRSTLGARLNGKAGGLDATLEAAWQFGGASTGARGQDHDVHINAHAEALRVGYTFEPVPMKPRIGIEIDYASGDNCKTACGHANTFDNLYPTNHFHYGYMDLMSWRNMVNYHIVADLKPDPVSKVQVNFILHRLSNSKDHWYRAGQVVYGNTAATNTAQSIGQELDIHYWRTFKEKFKFEVGYGHLFTGDYIEQAANGNGTLINGVRPGTSDQNWGYVMGSVLF